MNRAVVLAMRMHTPFSNPGLYFVTFTCYKWIPLIEIVNGYGLVYKWFNVLKMKGHDICGYVIMPNHIHLLMYYNGGPQSLNIVIGNGKRFLSYGIVERLKSKKQFGTLSILRKGVNASDTSKRKVHEVWSRSFIAKECYKEEFTFQKLQYIHKNPCKGKRKLAPDITMYPHSSAKYYLTWKQGIYPVADYRKYLPIAKDIFPA